MLNVDLITVMYTSTLAKKKQKNKETKTKAPNNKRKQNK